MGAVGETRGRAEVVEASESVLVSKAGDEEDEVKRKRETSGRASGRELRRRERGPVLSQ